MAREPNHLNLPHQIRIQTAVILLSLPRPRKEDALPLGAGSDMRRMKTVRKRENETWRTSRAESEAAVAAMQAKPKEEPHAKADAEVGPRPNYDMGAVPNGAPPQCLREESAKSTCEAGAATPHRPQNVSFSLVDRATVTRHRCARTKNETAVAAMQGASEAEPLPLLVGKPEMPHHEAAVAAMERATSEQTRWNLPLRTSS